MTKPTPPHAPHVSASGYELGPLGEAERESLASSLSREERRVLLDHGTERPFCGTLLDNKLHGTYACRLCGLPLFRSAAKFDSGTGWPSFYEAYDEAHVANIEDHGHGMVRTEIRCRRCDGHLGHVFPDGPRPTGLRYCLNSAALEFYEKGQELPRKTKSDRAGPAKSA
jgi:peptide-methionine (R)-S-oxide reductase